MPWKCCVWKCDSTVKSPGIRLFRFPTIGKSLKQLSGERIEKWRSVLGYGINFSTSNKRICSLHFQNGKPARLTDAQDPDWVPSLQLLKTRSSVSCATKRCRRSRESNSISSNTSDSCDKPARSDESSFSSLSKTSWDSDSSKKGRNSSETPLKRNSASTESMVSSNVSEKDGVSQRRSPDSVANADRSMSCSLSRVLSGSSSRSSDDSESPIAMKSFSRPNVTPLVFCEYEEDKPKKNVSTMTDVITDPSKIIENYRREVQRLQTKINSIQNMADFFERGFEFISVSNEKCLYYTGITHFSTVKHIYEYVKPNLSEPHCDFSTEQMFVMTLSKLRLNPQFQSLAYDYNVSLNTISKYFHRTLQIMDTCLCYALEVPPKEVLLRHTPKAPKAMREKFGDKRIFVIDCFEIRSETPDEPKAAVSHYSNYKKSETAKFLIAVTPDGNICFISPGYGGRCSDKKIVQDCGVLNILEPGDVVLADKGFDIRDLILSRGASLNIPTFLKDKKQFLPSDIEKDRQITSVRIHVERCIGVLKSKFLVMSQVVTVTSLARFENGKNVIDLIARVCAILYNFNPSIIPDSPA